MLSRRGDHFTGEKTKVKFKFNIHTILSAAMIVIFTVLIFDRGLIKKVDDLLLLERRIPAYTDLIEEGGVKEVRNEDGMVVFSIQK